MTTYLIREMPEGDRPRERLQARGAAALGDGLGRTAAQASNSAQLSIKRSFKY